MRLRDDFSMGLRGLFSRPLETMLLILGIALGIGATAAGLSLFIRTVEVGDELLVRPEYREIVVSAGTDASASDGPAQLVTEDTRVVFTSEDLKSADEIEAVSHAYFVWNTEFYTGNKKSGFTRQGAGRMRMLAEGNQNSGSEEEYDKEESGPDLSERDKILEDIKKGEFPEDIPEEMKEEIKKMFEAPPEIDDPQPVLDVIKGRMVSPKFFDAMELEISQGDFFSQNEITDRSNVIILGAELAGMLYEDGESYGRKIILNNMIYTITGILSPTGTGLDEYGYTPFFINDFIAKFFSADIHFMVDKAEDLDEAEFQIYRWFRMKHGDVTVETPREQAEEANSRNSRLAAIILFLAGAGFLIASVNVSNIMLGRTIRQFRNIGILKALGASAADIFRLYFIESLFLSVCGMLGGICITVILSRLISSGLGAGSLSFAGAVIGIIAAVIITAALTIYPSLQASRVPAAQAIKTE